MSNNNSDDWGDCSLSLEKGEAVGMNSNFGNLCLVLCLICFRRRLILFLCPQADIKSDRCFPQHQIIVRRSDITSKSFLPLLSNSGSRNKLTERSPFPFAE